MNVKRISTIVKMEVIRIFTDPLNLIFTMLLVPVLILIFGLSMNNNYGWDPTYSIFEIMVPGFLAYACLLTIYDVASNVAGGREFGLQKRIDTTPLSTAEYILSQMIAYTIKPLLQFALGYGIAYALGYRPQIGFVAYLLIFVLVVLLTFSSVGLGLITASFSKTGAAAGGLAFIFIVPQQLFATFIPPAFIGADSFKWVFPSFYTTAGLGHIFSGQSLSAPYLWMLIGILFAISLVMYIIGMLVYDMKKKS